MKLFHYLAAIPFIHLTLSALPIEQELQNQNIENIDISSLKNLNQRCCNFLGKTSQLSIGKAGYAFTTPFNLYTILVPTYPESVLLSKNRNTGSVKGRIKLLDTGLKIKKAGNYFVTFSAGLNNPEPDYTAFILVFIALDGVFNVEDPFANGGDVVQLDPLVGAIAKGSAVLRNVPAGTTITLFASNLGSPYIQPINIGAWNINIFEISENE